MAGNNTTEEKIYQAAFRLFMSRPYELVTISDIEKAIGMTRGAIFYYVKDKHELFERVIERYFVTSQNLYNSIGEDILYKDITLLEFINIYIAALAKKIDTLYAFVGIDKSKADKNTIQQANCSYLALAFNIGYHLNSSYYERIDSLFRIDKNTWSFFIQKAIERGEVKPNTNVSLFGEIFTSIYLGTSFHDAFANGVDVQKMKLLFMEIYDRIKY